MLCSCQVFHLRKGLGLTGTIQQPWQEEETSSRIRSMIEMLGPGQMKVFQRLLSIACLPSKMGFTKPSRCVCTAFALLNQLLKQRKHRGHDGEPLVRGCCSVPDVPALSSLRLSLSFEETWPRSAGKSQKALRRVTHVLETGCRAGARCGQHAWVLGSTRVQNR